MSQVGFLILTKPAALRAACRGWTRRHLRVEGDRAPEEFTPTRPSVSFQEGALALTLLQPLSLEMKLGMDWKHICKSESIAFVGYDLDGLHSEEDIRDAMETPFPVYEISEDDADVFFGGHPVWKSYASRELRELAELRTYFFLDSY